jgi:NitT/TauT family transport system substrate-binding protein
MKILRLGIVLLLGTTGILFSGCGIGGGQSVDLESDPLLIGTNVWPGYEPLYLARELGYFDSSGLRLVEYTSATEVIRAFKNDTIGVAALTLDEVLLLRQDGIDVHVILVIDISNGADVILAKPHIESLADLRGKRVGIESSALGAYVIHRALSMAEMSISDITVVALEVDEQEEAYLDGTVDAVVTFEPMRSRLISTGARQLFDSTQIPGEVVDVLAVNDEAHERFGEHLQVLLVAWFKALQYQAEQPEKAAQLSSRRMKIAPSEVLSALKGLRFPPYSENVDLLGQGSTGVAAIADRLVGVMVEADLLREGIDLDGLVSASMVEAIEGDL